MSKHKGNPAPIKLDGGRLVRLKRNRPGDFKKMVEQLREQGHSDREIIAAMVASPELINALR